MNDTLNQRTFHIVDEIAQFAEELRIQDHHLPEGGRVLDFGIEAEGGLDAGLTLARICMAGLGDVQIMTGEIAGIGWPHVVVTTDHPTVACLYSQYAGWQISVDKYFAMGSGPMRAAAGSEEVFLRSNYKETVSEAVGILETATMPDESVFAYLSEKTGVEPSRMALLVAPTASQSGNVQIVARSVETALHKLFELDFDVNRIQSAYGTTPLSPVAADDLTGIGRTNDAILYGGRVTLWVNGDDDSLQEIGPKVPANASECYGQPFLDIFEAAGRDFYAIDRQLFSPAEIVFQNLETGNVHHFGQVNVDVLQKSFGL